METLADQRIADGIMTRSQYENIRADIATQITKARAIEDHRATVILCCKFLNNFPSSGLAPIGFRWSPSSGAWQAYRSTAWKIPGIIRFLSVMPAYINPSNFQGVTA